jgi:hypothetical protein
VKSNVMPKSNQADNNKFDHSDINGLISGVKYKIKQWSGTVSGGFKGG